MIDTLAATRTNTRGNYVCNWCPKSWKRMDAEFIENHIRNNHIEEYVRSEYQPKITRLEGENRDLREKLKVAMTPAPPPEKKPEKQYYQCVLYCTVENKVMKAGMPKGVLPENVTCSGCGIKGALKITNNDPSWLL